MSAPAAELGVRFLVPDRPGFGDSTAVSGRSIVDVAGDLLTLVRSLDVRRFGIVAQSGRTPYALALAAAAQNDVTGLSFIGGISPLDEPDALQDVSGPARMLYILGRRAPWLLRPLMGARTTDAEEPGNRRADVRKGPARGRPEGARGPGVVGGPRRRLCRVSLLPGAFVHEARLLAQPWGVDLSLLTAPSAFWVGECDPVHPPVMSRRMAERLGGAPVTVVPGAATFGMLPVFGDAIRQAAALTST